MSRLGGLFERRIKRPYQRHFLWVELALSVAITAAFLFCVEHWYGRAELVEFLKGSRQATYTVIASTGGALLGFVLTAASIVLVIGDSPALQLVRERGQYGQVFRIFFQAILWIAIATVWAFIGLLGDTDTAPRPVITYVMVLLSLAAGFRLYRCVWILREVTVLVVRYHENHPVQARSHLRN